MLPAPAAVVVVQEDLGGEVRSFASRVADYRRHHVVVRIMGECASACTMVTAVDDRRLCVGPNAKLEFHQAYHPDPFDPNSTSIRAEDGTQTLLRHYPPKLRAWIDRMGGLTKDLITLAGPELRSIFRPCS